MPLVFRLILLSIALAYSVDLVAQRDSANVSKKKKFDALEERSKVKYRFIPIPSFDPATKWGLAGVYMANYYADKMDTVSPPSMSGISVFGTSNGSWGGGLLQNYNFKEDRWRLEARLWYLNINQVLNLGPLGNADATRKMLLANVMARRQVLNDFFLGLGYNFASVEYDGRDDESDIILDLAGYNQKARNHGLKYSILFDTRDNIFYPYKGLYLEYGLEQNFENNSTDVDDGYLEHLLDLRYFTAISQNTNHMLAFHFVSRILTGDPTNENYSFYGRSGALIQRGYEFGSFVDKNMVTLEVEYRRETSLMKNRLGFAGFVSTGKVYGDYFSFSDADWLPAAGLGIRYRFLEYERMNFKADVAYGKEGWTVYFGIREAF